LKKEKKFDTFEDEEEKTPHTEEEIKAQEHFLRLGEKYPELNNNPKKNLSNKEKKTPKAPTAAEIMGYDICIYHFTCNKGNMRTRNTTIQCIF
jgi:cell shape-determining protein MreC